jgi:bacterioferritin-associated ferredoxin
VIVCSCNALTKQQILDALASETAGSVRTPAQTYRCLGCAPDCGRCLVTVRAILKEARGPACHVGCVTCPSHAQAHDAGFEVYAIAAE